MKRYRCKCGLTTWVHADPTKAPMACETCKHCGSTLGLGVVRKLKGKAVAETAAESKKAHRPKKRAHKFDVKRHGRHADACACGAVTD